MTPIIKMADEEELTTCRSKTNEDVEAEPMFCPPLYRQRYSAVLDIIAKEGAKKIVDLGCAECKFIPLLRSMDLEEVAGVDIDRHLLEDKKYLIRPLPAEYLCQREHPFRIRLFEGNIAEYDSRLDGFDCVTMIEVIEHLFDDVLTAFPPVVFGKIKPRLVIMTTPNSEFNVLFPNFTGMRHFDHKFEWTRQEFQTWCNNISTHYGYSVEFGGVGAPPAERQDLGSCSQMAIFRLQTTEDTKVQDLKSEEESQTQPYNMVTEQNFPYKIKPPREVALPIEAQYYLRKVVIMERENRNRAWAESDGTEDDEKTEVTVKLEELLVFKGISENCSSIPELREALKSIGCSFTKGEESVILQLDDDDEDDDSDDDYYSSVGNLDDSSSEDHEGETWEDSQNDFNQDQVEEEKWDVDDDNLSAQTRNVIPFEEMWADADADTDADHNKLCCQLYLGRGNNDFIADFIPEEHGIEPRMLYIPSVLHAPPAPRKILNVDSEDGQFTDDFPEGGSDQKMVRMPLVKTSGITPREIVKDFVVERGQFDDVGEYDELGVNLETLTIGAVEDVTLRNGNLLVEANER